jgi:hypothetical protein
MSISLFPAAELITKITGLEEPSGETDIPPDSDPFDAA